MGHRRTSSRLMVLAALGCLASMAASCGNSSRHDDRGNVGNSGTSSGGTGTGGGTSAGAGNGAGGDEPTCLPDDPRSVVAPQRIVRLTRLEVVNTARALNVIDDATASSILDDADLGHIGDETQLLFPPLVTPSETGYIDSKKYPALDGIAKRAAAYVFDHFEEATGCATPSDACATDYLTRLAAKAYRRPLTNAEERRIVGLYDRLRNQTLNGWVVTSSVQEATRTAVRAVLVSPETLWRSEVGDPGLPAPAEGSVALGDHELATALAFFLTNQPPDAELLDAASGGTLRDSIVAQTERLLATPEARSWLTRVMVTYFRLNAVPNVVGVVDWEKFGIAEPVPLVSAMQEEASRFMDHTLWNLDLSSLLTSRTTFLDENLAMNIYGLTLPGASPTTFVETELPADERAGIITLSGFLTSVAGADRESVIHRGLHVLGLALCQTLPGPPESDVGEIIARCGEPETEQEKAACRIAEPACAGCHALSDPFGLALEAYDNVGRYRTSVVLDDGRTVPVDSRATLPPVLDSEPVRDGVDMAEKLAESPLFTNCMAASVLQYALAEIDTSPVRPPPPLGQDGEQGCAVEGVIERYRANAAPTFEGLVRAIVTSPAFGARRIGEP